MEIRLITQDGTAMVITLLMVLIVGLSGTCLLGVARMENCIAVNEERAEQARQAADAGVYIGRNVFLNHLMNGKDVYSIEDVHISDTAFVYIEIMNDEGDQGGSDNDRIMNIKSTGTVLNASGTVAARQTALARVQVDSSVENEVVWGRIVSFEYIYGY